MPSTIASLEFLAQQLELAEQLQSGKDRMFTPQDLPGRYGRVVRSVDHVLHAIGCESVVGGGWAVWRLGYVARLTNDLDIVLPADRIDEFLRAATVSGFEVLPQPAGRWPKVLHKETSIQVDILPEGARPGTPSQMAPTLIRHPNQMGAGGAKLHYISLPALIELKLAAGRGKDDADVIELLRTNVEQIEAIRHHLAAIHAEYVAKFDRLAARAQEDQER